MKVKDKKEQILEVAEELFAEFGYEGTSVRDLAKKSGVNVAMISYYFGSKEELMKSLIIHRSEYLYEKLQMLNEDKFSPEKKIEMLIDFYVHRIIDMNRFHKILQREMSLQQRSAFNRIISDIFSKNKAMINNMIDEGYRKKVFRKVDNELLMASLIGTISHMILASNFNCQLLNISPDAIRDNKNKVRLKKHLTAMLKAHLMLPAKIKSV